jgi:YVTN family beta-propeller protein
MATLAVGALASVPSLGTVLAQPAAPAATFSTPTNSSPIAMTNDKLFVWAVSPDDDSVYVINAQTNALSSRITVGDEPRSIAIDPDSEFAYVANAADNTVSIIRMTGGGAGGVIEKTFITGAEPWDVVISPDGKRVYVANAVQDTITIIRADAASPSIIGNVELNNDACNADNAKRHFQPRGLAVSLDNTKLFVARFLSMVKTGGVQATDDGKEGLVCRLDINTAGVTKATSVTGFTPRTLASVNTGFADRNGNATAAYPNQMQSIVLRGDVAYMPNIAASAKGPLRFNVDTHAYVSQINTAGGVMADGGSLNMHLGARVPESGKKKLFFANPWAMAFTNQSGDGNAYVVASASDLLVKLNVNGAGALSFTGGVSTTSYVDLNNPDDAATQGAKAGKNPVGIVIGQPGNVGNLKAFVLNYVSRNISVVDLSTDSVVATVQLQALPVAGSQDEQLQVGAEIFFSSRGNFERPAGTNASTSTQDRLSSEGWQACASCHFNGWTDGEVWSFNAGPRKSVPLNGTWSPHNPDDQRVLNYSAIFDEVQDFELNIRNVSGPGPLAAPVNGSVLNVNQGLLISDTGDINSAPLAVAPFVAKANAGRPQHTVKLPGSSTAWPALDAMKEWVRFAIRTPNGALTNNQLSTAPSGSTGITPNPDTTGGLSVPDVNAGRRLFFQAGCGSCHAGPKWTLSRKDFTSPPALAELSTEAPLTTTVGAQFMNRFLRDIKSFNLNVNGAGNAIAGQPQIGAPEKNEVGLDALGNDQNGDGKGKGFNVPSLLGIWHLPPYYHNGACETLACVLANSNHRAAGLKQGQTDPLASATNQAKVEAWLKTLDAETLFPTDLRVNRHDIFVDPPTVFVGQVITIGVNVQLFGQRSDLADLIADLGIAATLKGEIEFDGQTKSFVIAAADFDADFGKAIYTGTFNAPADAGQKQIKVTLDVDDVLPEDTGDGRANNEAKRNVRVRNLPADTTTPKVNSIFISDDNPFLDTDAIVTTRNVKVKINAEDPTSVTRSGLKEYCIVRYFFNAALRRWVESDCTFEPLPTPTAGDLISGTFIVDAEIPNFAGSAYAFVWVKDAAGNISRRPGFDVVSYIPASPININRNDVRLFRILTPPATTISFTVNIVFGDVDLAVFDGVTASANRIGVSANNGTTTEVISFTNTGGADQLFQVEVEAIVNSSVTIATQQAPAVAADLALAEKLARDASLAPEKNDKRERPFVSGPPALQTAVGDDAGNSVYLPVILK